MSIEPDTKDWTWVLERPCPECGFDASSVSFEDVSMLVRDNARQWPAVLERTDARDRPRANRWSPLEYACHVRDVFRLFDIRLHRMLEESDPAFANWDQDDSAVADRYSEQDPAAVGRELVEAGDQIADTLAAVTADQRGRTGTRSDGARFTVETFARYLIHDPVHHLWDVR